MCSNDIRTLTGSPVGGTFIIANGPGVISGNALSATGPGIIDLIYKYSDVCTKTDVQNIIVNEAPEAYAGPDQELTFIFEANLKAEHTTSQTGEWSVVSGSGQIKHLTSPNTHVTGLSLGENIFRWTVRNEICEASDEIVILVNDLNKDYHILREPALSWLHEDCFLKYLIV